MTSDFQVHSVRGEIDIPRPGDCAVVHEYLVKDARLAEGLKNTRKAARREADTTCQATGKAHEKGPGWFRLIIDDSLPRLSSRSLFQRITRYRGRLSGWGVRKGAQHQQLSVEGD